MNEAYLLIGGNIGDREHYLAKARDLIQKNCGRLISASSIYETQAWGLHDQPPFLNQALAIQTHHLPGQLLDQLLAIERQEGREREVKYGPRILDIDILLYESQIVTSAALIIPHPQMQFRRFVLEPLAEIAGQILHPVLNKTINELLTDCPDPLKVTKLKPANKT